MKFQLLALFFAFFALVAAVELPKTRYMVSFEQDTPDSVIEQTKAAFKNAVCLSILTSGLIH